MKQILLCFIIVLIVSCKSRTETAGLLEFEETISFQASDMVLTNPGMIQLVETDSGEFIFYYNHIIKKLQFTEFPSGKHILNVPLEFDEEKRARRLTGVTLISKDTIGVTFFLQQLESLIFLGIF
ncbi:hypothetical protein MM239_05595 [Belliella sp. DSM 111904]|uniref:Lipoprotein n=1 Tax=Belliella filtrata TaxID=2923435 RepID=A0ABS9UXL8_9BACT|nr:hypothetical protein [Belliella filtrata]MCH7408859.1 hypothetical protein [Belliella filtrata]